MRLALILGLVCLVLLDSTIAVKRDGAVRHRTRSTTENSDVPEPLLLPSELVLLELADSSAAEHAARNTLDDAMEWGDQQSSRARRVQKALEEHVPREWREHDEQVRLYMDGLRQLSEEAKQHTHTFQLLSLNERSPELDAMRFVTDDPPAGGAAAASGGAAAASGGGVTNPTYLLPVDPYNYYPFFNGYSNVNPFSQFYPPPPNVYNSLAAAHQAASAFGSPTAAAYPPMFLPPAYGSNPWPYGAGVSPLFSGPPLPAQSPPGASFYPFGPYNAPTAAPTIATGRNQPYSFPALLEHEGVPVEPVMFRPTPAEDGTYTVIQRGFSEGHEGAPVKQTCVNCDYFN